MYVVIVDFRIRPERLAEFMPLMLENARASRFDAAVAPMLASKAVRILERLTGASAQPRG